MSWYTVHVILIYGEKAMQSRYMLKLRAKQILVSVKPSPLFAGMMLTAVSFLIYIFQYSTGGNTYAELINSGVRDTAKLSEALVADLTGNTGALILRIVFLLLNAYISFGLVCYSFRLSSGDTAVPLQEMFPPLLSFLKFFLLSVIITAAVAVGAMFFIVPGIILALCYSQAKYIMLDHPEMSVIQCLTASRKLMRGHLGEYFVLVLSFIGWNILTSISVITGIWTFPYTGITMALYYRDISAVIIV